MTSTHSTIRLLRKVAIVAGIAAALVALSGCAVGFRGPATNVSATGATLHGSVVSNRSELGTWWFQYGKTTSYGTETPHRSITFVAGAGQDVSEPIAGLTADTSYHYRLCAKDQDPKFGANCSGDQTFATTCTPGAPGCGWQDGDIITYSQGFWGDPGEPAGVILSHNYDDVYASTFGVLEVGIPGASGYSISFLDYPAVLAYLPQPGSPGALTNDLVNPTSSPAGQFGGEVVALQLNVDFSDAGVTLGSTGILVGVLRVCGTSTANGLTIREVLDLANTALGGGSSISVITSLSPLIEQINAAFSGGSPSTFAQQHLVNGPCP